jgi:hypothetical protein
MDGSRDYKSNAFKTCCDNNSITHQMTTSYMPQTKWCCQMEDLNISQKCLLYDAICDDFQNFWVEVVAIANYIQNCFRTKVVHHVTPNKNGMNISPQSLN